MAMTAFSRGCNFETGLGKHQLRTIFEVASFSHSVNIEGKPPNIGELPLSRAKQTFLLDVVL